MAARGCNTENANAQQRAAQAQRMRQGGFLHREGQAAGDIWRVHHAGHGQTQPPGAPLTKCRMLQNQPNRDSQAVVANQRRNTRIMKKENTASSFPEGRSRSARSAQTTASSTTVRPAERSRGNRASGAVQQASSGSFRNGCQPQAVFAGIEW